MEKETYNFLLTGINKYLEVSEIIREINNDTVYSAKDFDYTIAIKDDLDNTPESLQLQQLQRKIVFLIAKYQNGGTGVSTQFLVNNANENSTPKSISVSVNGINNASQEFFQNEGFKLITKAGQSHYIINGKEVENQRSFTIDEFFDVFSFKIHKVKFNKEPRTIAGLTDNEKENLFFGLFEQDIIEEDKLIGLYRSLNSSISAPNAFGIFEKTRIKLKNLLIDKEVFELDMLDQNENLNSTFSKLKTWNDSKSIFPRNSKGDYYSCYKKKVLEIVASKKIETYFKFDWVSHFWDYDFSTEEQCIDIDDVIVSFALLALSNYQLDVETDKNNESNTLKTYREKYKQAVKKLIRERFGPTGDNHKDIIELFDFAIVQQIRDNLKEKGHSNEVVEDVLEDFLGELKKTFDNKNVYFNEDNDHSITK